MSRSRDLIRNGTRAGGREYTWNAKLFCDLDVDSIRSLIGLNAIKRTHLLTEYNDSHTGTQFLEVLLLIN